jgi:hypothetical protein
VIDHNAETANSSHGSDTRDHNCSLFLGGRKSHSNTKPLNQNVGKQRKTNYGKTTEIRGVADKSLARPTSRCHRTQSIVLLEMGVCSCAELQVFLLQRLKGSM